MKFQLHSTQTNTDQVALMIDHITYATYYKDFEIALVECAIRQWQHCYPKQSPIIQLQTECSRAILLRYMMLGFTINPAYDAYQPLSSLESNATLDYTTFYALWKHYQTDPSPQLLTQLSQHGFYKKIGKSLGIKALCAQNPKTPISAFTDLPDETLLQAIPMVGSLNKEIQEYITHLKYSTPKPFPTTLPSVIVLDLPEASALELTKRFTTSTCTTGISEATSTTTTSPSQAPKPKALQAEVLTTTTPNPEPQPATFTDAKPSEHHTTTSDTSMMPLLMKMYDKMGELETKINQISDKQRVLEDQFNQEKEKNKQTPTNNTPKPVRTNRSQVPPGAITGQNADPQLQATMNYIQQHCQTNPMGILKPPPGGGRRKIGL